MSVSKTHVLSQGPVIGALLSTVGRVALRQIRNQEPSAPTVPGPVIRATLQPRPKALVRDYIRAVGGSPSSYRKVLPPHMFPQWGVPLLSKTLADVPYDLTRVLNAGCRLEINRPLPADEPLQVEAFLEEIDDDGRRAILHQRLVTSTASAPEALVAHVRAVVILSRDKSGKRKDRPRVPGEAREIGRFGLKPTAGLDYALVTGDFNPIHWLGPYARMAGFRGRILHGFGTLAWAIEGLNRARLSGDASRLRSIDVRFTRPLVLPRKVGLYIDDHDGIFIGEAPGGPAYLVGTTALREESTP